jgi:hypothetical protein
MVEALPLWQVSGWAHLLWERTRQIFNRGVSSSPFLNLRRNTALMVRSIDTEGPLGNESFDGVATPFRARSDARSPPILTRRE